MNQSSDSDNAPLIIHSLVKKIIDVRDGKEKSFIFVEGRRLIEDLIKSNLGPTDAVATIDQLPSLKKIISSSSFASCRIFKADGKLMKRMSAHDTPPGLLCLARRPPPRTIPWDQIKKPPLILFLHQIQNPQNVGALIRTAEAAGVTEVWTSDNTCDPYSPKALRGSAGSIFRMAIQTNQELEATLSLFKEKGIIAYAAMKNGAKRLDETDLKKPTAILLGNEGVGLDEEKIINKTVALRIPMHGEVESLNVGVAGALILYEAFRQRGGFYEPKE